MRVIKLAYVRHYEEIDIISQETSNQVQYTK